MLAVSCSLPLVLALLENCYIDPAVQPRVIFLINPLEAMSPVLGVPRKFVRFTYAALLRMLNSSDFSA